MRKHNPDHVAALAAQLLPAHGGTEIHHVRRAIVTAKLILDEAHGPEEADEDIPAKPAKPAKAEKPAE